MKKIICLLISFLFAFINAQVGVNNTSPQATLDVTAINIDNAPSGLIPPRLTYSQLKKQTIDKQLYKTNQNGAIIYVINLSDTLSTDPRMSSINAIGYHYWDATANKWTPFTLRELRRRNVTVGTGVSSNSGKPYDYPSLQAAYNGEAKKIPNQNGGDELTFTCSISTDLGSLSANGEIPKFKITAESNGPLTIGSLNLTNSNFTITHPFNGDIELGSLNIYNSNIKIFNTQGTGRIILSNDNHNVSYSSFYIQAKELTINGIFNINDKSSFNISGIKGYTIKTNFKTTTNLTNNSNLAIDGFGGDLLIDDLFSISNNSNMNIINVNTIDLNNKGSFNLNGNSYLNIEKGTKGSTLKNTNIPPNSVFDINYSSVNIKNMEVDLRGKIIKADNSKINISGGNNIVIFSPSPADCIESISNSYIGISSIGNTIVTGGGSITLNLNSIIKIGESDGSSTIKLKPSKLIFRTHSIGLLKAGGNYGTIETEQSEGSDYFNFPAPQTN